MKLSKSEIREIIREALIEEGFFDGTKKWEKARQENAEVFGYKLTGKSDVKKHIEVKHSHDGVSHIGQVSENRVHLSKIQTRKDKPAFKTRKRAIKEQVMTMRNVYYELGDKIENLIWMADRHTDFNDDRKIKDFGKKFLKIHADLKRHLDRLYPHGQSWD